ncbi:DUF456 domain-containing protein [Nesterenkonia sphaerica]|uniref:DUF456 domain-containing protein n=1 Tax=Nesterenkonia sphaerica TaxID=1804988 RepID=A0A5R9A6A8_9MICC|nr:DUF456 domain-containing protein [Nesterenkonia sphaerica]TLP74232.1 DUF456 domain-containing protein [Nesterenkonia sphaerica]
MLESTAAETVATLVAGIVLIAGLVSVVVPVLPGSLLVIVALLVWAVLLGGPTVWAVSLAGVMLALLGWSASTVLTGRVLRRESIPRGPILVALAAGLVGLIVLPPLGLFLGFALGLFCAEYFRRERDWRAAGSSSLQALRAVGIGLLVEFFCAGVAVSLFVIGAVIHLVF